MEMALVAMKILLGFGLGYPILSLLAFSLVLVAVEYRWLPETIDQHQFLKYSGDAVINSIKVSAGCIVMAIILGAVISYHI